MIRTALAFAVLLILGCGGQRQEEAPRALPVEKVQVRVQLLEAVDGLETALAGWAAAQAVEVVTVVGDDGIAPSLREIELEDLDALRTADALRAFPATMQADDAAFWAGSAGWRDGQLLALPWRADVVGLLLAAEDEFAPLESWRDLDGWIQAHGPLVLDRNHLARALVPLAWSAGGAWADSLGGLQLATDPSREALSFLERLVTEERCLEASALEDALASGDAAITVAGLALRARLGEGARLRHFPPVEVHRGRAAAWLRPRAWTLPAGGPDAKLAAELAWHLATDPACLALLAPLHLPAFRAAAPGPDSEDVASVLASARLAPASGSWASVEEALAEAVAATTARRRTPGAALDDADRRVRATVRSR